MRSYLVTGGCGFIGSHLADALLAAGHRVRILDDLSTGKRANKPAGATLIEGDVADPETVGGAIDGADGVFHLAAIASVERGNREWLATHRVNVGGTITVLDAARRAGRLPVVYASSAAVYGDNPNVPLAEDAATRPLSAYGVDKLSSELHGRVARHVHGVPAVGLRLFNVFGPRQDPASPYSGVISIFCDRIDAGEEVTVYGDGRQTRDFVFVDDVVAGLLAAMERLPDEPAVLNLCTGVATSVLDLVGIVGELCRKPPRIVHAAPRAGDIRASSGDPGLAERRLGWRPAVALRDGLRRTLTA